MKKEGNRKGKKKLSHYLKEKRPWGSFERFTLNQLTTVKIIRVKTGHSISLQTHKHRDEFWHVFQGSGVIRIGDIEHQAKKGDNFFCPRDCMHRVTGGKKGTTFLEVAFGHFDEDDIDRHEDLYGRSPRVVS